VSIEARDRWSNLRHSDVAATIRAARLIVVLRRITPHERLLELLDELADAGARIFEITLDGEDAGSDLVTARNRIAGRDRRCLVGAGTVRTVAQLRSAIEARAAFGVSPVFDPKVVAAALEAGLPFIPGVYTPTEADAAWRAGATFVKVFPGSSLGPSHVRELRGPMPDIEMIVTGGVNATNATEFLEAGAVAVGIGSALVRASARERRRLLASIAGAGAVGR
jgi:Entner-Doudoroff aldolase